VTEWQATYVRLPPDLHRRIKQRAELDDRTMAQEIRVALKFFLDETAPVPRKKRG
jgi:predicted DNA-binding protein